MGCKQPRSCGAFKKELMKNFKTCQPTGPFSRFLSESECMWVSSICETPKFRSSFDRQKNNQICLVNAAWILAAQITKKWVSTKDKFPRRGLKCPNSIVTFGSFENCLPVQNFKNKRSFTFFKSRFFLCKRVISSWNAGADRNDEFYLV